MQIHNLDQEFRAVDHHGSTSLLEICRKIFREGFGLLHCVELEVTRWQFPGLYEFQLIRHQAYNVNVTFISPSQLLSKQI